MAAVDHGIMTSAAVLVTGGSGFIGTHVCAALSDVLQGDAIQRWVRVLRAGREASPPDLKIDLGDDFAPLPPGIDTVVHLAGDKSNRARMWSVNRDGTRRLIEAAATAGVRRFVHLSSVGVYGALKHAGRVDESSAHVPRDPYESSKDAAERLVRELCPRYGLQWVVVQPSNVLGVVPGRTYPLLGLMNALRSGRFVWFGRRRRAWVNYVAVQDVAAAVVSAALSTCSGRTWIVNTPAPLDDVVAWCVQELGASVPTRRLPLALGWIAAHVAGPVSRLTGRALPIDAQRFRELTNSTVYDGGAITRDTGFTYPLGIEALVRSLARQYRHEGLV